MNVKKLIEKNKRIDSKDEKLGARKLAATSTTLRFENGAPAPKHAVASPALKHWIEEPSTLIWQTQTLEESIVNCRGPSTSPYCFVRTLCFSFDIR